MACDLLHCTDSSIYIIASQYLSISVLPHPYHWKFLLAPPPAPDPTPFRTPQPPSQPNDTFPIINIASIINIAYSSKSGHFYNVIADIEEFPKHCNPRLINFVFEIPTIYMIKPKIPPAPTQFLPSSVKAQASTEAG